MASTILPLDILMHVSSFLTYKEIGIWRASHRGFMAIPDTKVKYHARQRRIARRRQARLNKAFMMGYNMGYSWAVSLINLQQGRPQA